MNKDLRKKISIFTVSVFTGVFCIGGIFVFPAKAQTESIEGIDILSSNPKINPSIEQNVPLDKNYFLNMELNKLSISESNGNTTLGSNNENNLDFNTVTSINNSNLSDSNLNLNILDDTGNNEALGNVGDSLIDTGNINLGIEAVNVHNLNTYGTDAKMNTLNIGGGSGDVIFDPNAKNPSSANATSSSYSLDQSNINVGSNSNNVNFLTNTNELNVNNENDADAENNIVVNANTGENVGAGNIGSSTIYTGDINANLSLVNFLNANIMSPNIFMGTANIFDDYSGNIIIPEYAVANQPTNDPKKNALIATNKNTGSNSWNENYYNLNNELNLENDNFAFIENNLNYDLNTGENESNGNMCETFIETGDINSNHSEMTIANVNSDSKDWFLLVVNKVGGWIGSLLGAPEGTEFIDTGDSIIYSNNLSALNLGTGSGSQNTNVYDVNNETNISNVNSAIINNNIDLNLNTGNNVNSGNTGCTNTVTGDINLSSSIINFVNSNFFADNWFFMNVNIFGNFTGNVVLPFTPSANAQNSSQGNGIAFTNEFTGMNSTNINSMDITNESNILNLNTLYQADTYDFTLNTGDNEALGNTGKTLIDTGDIDNKTALGVLANVNEFENLGKSSQPGSFTFENINTGLGSTNENRFNLDNMIDMRNENIAELFGDFENNLNTGGNLIDGNIGNTYLYTGKAKNDFTNIADLNINSWVSPLTAFGSEGHFLNKNTAGSTNRNEIGVNADEQVNNFNNAIIHFDIHNSINSGVNSNIANIGKTLLETGNVASSQDYRLNANRNRTRFSDNSNPYSIFANENAVGNSDLFNSLNLNFLSEIDNRNYFDAEVNPNELLTSGTNAIEGNIAPSLPLSTQFPESGSYATLSQPAAIINERKS